MVKIREAEMADVALIAPRLRQSDALELAAEHGIGLPHLDALRRSLAFSNVAWTALLDDKPFCMFGASSAYESSIVGSPWLLATDDFETVPARYILRENRKYVKIMLQKYEYLYNFVYHKNARSINWLKSIGFTVYDYLPPLPRGVYGGGFYLFDMSRRRSV